MQSRHITVAPSPSTFHSPEAIYRSYDKQVRRWLSHLSPVSIVGIRGDIEDCFDHGLQAEDAAHEILRKYEDTQ